MQSSHLVQQPPPSHLVQQPPSHLVQQLPAHTDIPVKVNEPVADSSSRPPTKIKAKKKKSINIESLVAHDIKALRQRQDNPRPINGLPQLSTASQIDQRAVDSNLPAAIVSAPSILSNLPEPGFRGHTLEDSTSKEDFQDGIGPKSKFVLAESDRDVKSLDVTAAVDGYVSKEYMNEDQDQSLQVDSSPAGDPMSVDGSSEMTAMSFVNTNNDNKVRDEHLQAFATEAQPARYSLPPASEPEVGQRRTEPIDHLLPINNHSDKDEEMQDIDHHGSSHLTSGQLDLTRTPPIDISDPTQRLHSSSAPHIPVEHSITSLNLLGNVNVVADVILLQCRPKYEPPIDSSESASDVQNVQAGESDSLGHAGR